MNKIDKNVWVAVITILVLGLILFIGFSKGKTGTLISDLTDLTDQSSEEVSDTKTVKKISDKVLTYGEALIVYEGKRIQLGMDCQATPSNLALKNNTKIMIDNRSSLAREVEVGDTRMTISPWGLKEVTLSSGTLPITWYVDCGDSQNVASLLIQP